MSAVGTSFAGPLPGAADALEPPLPRWPSCWYVVARSADLKPRGLITGELAGRPYVLFRGAAGELAALDAHCPHMGTHLKHATVVGDQLRCPLHHWLVDRQGVCSGAEQRAARTSRKWPVAERFGLVFLHPGSGPPPPLPAPESEIDYTWTTGRPVFLQTDWRAMMVHGFDLLHLQAVHHRVVIDIPELGERGGAARLSYVSRVEGGGLSDWLMRRLSGDRIRVRQSCHGAIMVVESEVGDERTAALLGLTVRDGRVAAFGAFGTRRAGSLVALKLLLTRWLFTAFLRRDFAVIEGVRLRLDGITDRGVATLANYLRKLPELGEADG